MRPVKALATDGMSISTNGAAYRPAGRQHNWTAEFKARFGMTPDEAHEFRQGKPDWQFPDEKPRRA